VPSYTFSNRGGWALDLNRIRNKNEGVKKPSPAHARPPDKRDLLPIPPAKHAKLPYSFLYPPAQLWIDLQRRRVMAICAA
jgi:hypothetical protein